jgi:hypothetical protein
MVMKSGKRGSAMAGGSRQEGYRDESFFAPILPLGRAHRTGRLESVTYTFAPPRRWFRSNGFTTASNIRRKETGTVGRPDEVVPIAVSGTTPPDQTAEPRKNRGMPDNILQSLLEETQEKAREIDRNYRKIKEEYKRSLVRAGGLYSREIVHLSSQYKQVRKERRLIYEQLRKYLLMTKQRMAVRRDG